MFLTYICCSSVFTICKMILMGDLYSSNGQTKHVKILEHLVFCCFLLFMIEILFLMMLVMQNEGI